MKKTLHSTIVLLFATFTLIAQDFIGSGNTQVSVTTSHNAAGTSGDNVISGKGLNAKKYDASRFLQQATFFFDETEINSLEDMDYESWIDNEMNKSITYITPLHDAIYIEAEDLYYLNGGTGDYYGPSDKHFHYAWWQSTMNADDQLRQRVAYALSQIFVVSGRSDLGAFGEGLSVFYDMLLDNAFGNFRDLLFDVTMNPCMGYYLSSLNNRKTQGSIRPDENYAREIMQLFTIGLYQLNNDGTHMLDGLGNSIPTYNQADIKEFAKVFTGLKGGGWDDDSQNSGVPGFGTGIFGISKRVPMVMQESQHEPGVKTLLNGATTNSSGIGDINAAIDNLFDHPNVGPFIARRLIQRLVKSNPTPAYINRVATVFNDNGAGVRGDLGAVIKQILLDEEARSVAGMTDPSSGKLREPMLKFAHVVGTLEKDNPSGNYWNNGFDFMEGTNQHVMQSPTVFNFYLPDYQPNNQLNGLYSPEFQIFNTRTSINWMNFVHRWSVWGTLFWDWEGDYTENVYVDFTNYEPQSLDTEEYINKLDMLFTAGTLSDFTRMQIRNAMNSTGSQYNKSRLALTLILSSAEFSVMH